MPLAFNYCTDEDIALRVGSDYLTLCPDSQVMAMGKDGVFDSAQPWILTSATVDFLTLGVHARQVVALTQPSTAFPSTQYLAVEGVATYALNLRRLGKPAGIGHPPGLGGVTTVKFSIPTFDPQIDQASYDANRLFNIDPSIPGRDPGTLYDNRELQQYCVLYVLKMAYMIATKSSNSSYDIKHREVSDEFDGLLAGAQVQWGPRGESASSSTPFGARVIR